MGAQPVKACVQMLVYGAIGTPALEEGPDNLPIAAARAAAEDARGGGGSAELSDEVPRADLNSMRGGLGRSAPLCMHAIGFRRVLVS